MEENTEQTSFTFEIDNFSKKEVVISSPIFQSGGCEWFLQVFPKGNLINDHLSVFLNVANRESLRPGWTRWAKYSFILINQSGKELMRAEEEHHLFCKELFGWGRPKMLALSKLKEEGFLENDKLIVKVEVEVVEVVHQREVTEKEMIDFNGFMLLYTQVPAVSWIFVEHPNFVVDLKPMNQVVKTSYMNVLLGLIDSLNKPSLSEIDIIKFHSQLSKLTKAGFNLDWLKNKLDEVSLERKNLEVMESKLEEVSLEKKKSDYDVYEFRAEQLAERLRNLEVMVSNLRFELEKEKVEFLICIFLLVVLLVLLHSLAYSIYPIS